MRKGLLAFSFIASLVCASCVNAQELPDGTYIDWEESYTVVNGSLSRCEETGKQSDSCAGYKARYASPYAINLYNGRMWKVVCNAAYKKVRGMGPPGSGGNCTINGWN